MYREQLLLPMNLNKPSNHFLQPPFGVSIFFVTPCIGLFFEVQQHTIPQKTTFLMNIYNFSNENIVFSEKFEKSQI